MNFFQKQTKNNLIAGNADNIWKKPHGFCIIREKECRKWQRGGVDFGWWS